MLWATTLFPRSDRVVDLARTSPPVPWQGITSSGWRPSEALPAAALPWVPEENPEKMPLVTPPLILAPVWATRNREPDAMTLMSSALAVTCAPPLPTVFVASPTAIVASPGTVAGWPGVGTGSCCAGPAVGV